MMHVIQMVVGAVAPGFIRVLATTAGFAADVILTGEAAGA
jgi:hypothetical protein